VPENTIPAFIRALELGADAIELDVHATRDGVVVVHHDPVLHADRVPVSQSVAIADLTLSEVRDYPLPGGIVIPTLREVLDAVGAGPTVYVEIKGTNIEALVVRCVRESKAMCAIHSFDHQAIYNVGKIFPAIRTGVLQTARPLDPAALLIATGAEDLWQEVAAIDADLVTAVHAQGARLIAWTSNDAEEWKTLRDFRVDGICTDRIEALTTFEW
jgi:glycerophosphoryl diester phosphodiesterase